MRSGVVTAFGLATLAWIASAWASQVAARAPHAGDGSGIVVLEPTPQRLGDPDAGREYLLYGDYIGSGIPRGLFDAIRGLRGGGDGGRDVPALERRGPSARIPHGMNLFTTPEGVEVVAGANCLACHASMLNGELVIGLGNSLSDWTGDGGRGTTMLRTLGAMSLPAGSPERTVLERFLRGTDVLRERADTPFRGVNPAFRIEELAAAHRRPGDLSWSETPVFEPRPTTVASDVPPLWNVRKKAALYYNGMGRGDFATLIQQITVVGIEDATDAARIDRSMPDLLAYLWTLEPPPFPGDIDEDLALRGERVFAARCASCHGTYGQRETYPNKLVPVSEVGTDETYARAMMESGLPAWFNESWFARAEVGDDAGDGAGPRGTYAAPTFAYVAPPLDGVWATAPYLHNGSVPTLAALLDSSTRPVRWRRSFRDDDYDLESVGWRWRSVEPGAADVRTYDTTLPGYGSGGHTYGDPLDDADRRALLEYLKTL